MDFGYFTLSDNHYDNNPRSSNQFVADITAEALYAEQLGMHSAWIGEHHFNSLGVLSCPDLVLAYVAARTQAHPPGAGGDRAAAAPPDPRRRAVGDARSALRRPRRFRRRARLRPARISSVPCVLRGQPGHLRRGHGARPQAVDGRRPHLPPRPTLFVRRRARSRRSRCSGRSRPMSDRSRSRRSSLRRGSAAG